MARKRYSDEDILNLLWRIELDLNTGSDAESACRKAGISDATYYTWRKRYISDFRPCPFRLPYLPVFVIRHKFPSSA